MDCGSCLVSTFFVSAGDRRPRRTVNTKKNIRSGVSQNNADNVLDDVCIVECPKNPCDEAAEEER